MSRGLGAGRARYAEDEEWDFFDSARGSASAHRSGTATGATTAFDYSGSGRDTGEHSIASSSAFLGCDSSSIASFGYEEEYDHKSTEKVRRLFEEIDDVLYGDHPRTRDSTVASKAPSDECSLWASTFSHLRTRGVGLVPSQENGVEMVPRPPRTDTTSAAASSSSAAHDLPAVDGLVSLVDFDELAVRGTRAEIRPAPTVRGADGRSEGGDDASGKFAFLEEEIFAIDGEVEECFARDESDTDGFLANSTGTYYRRGGFPPLSPNACVRDAVNSQTFDHMWTEMLPLLRPLLTAMINYFVPNESSQPQAQSRKAPSGSGIHRGRVGSGGTYGRAGSASSAAGTDYGSALVNAMTIRPLALNSRGGASKATISGADGSGSRPGSGGYGAGARSESAGRQSRTGVVYRYGQAQQLQQSRDAAALAGGPLLQRARRAPQGGATARGGNAVSGAHVGEGLSEGVLRGTSYQIGPAKSPSPVPSNAGSPTPQVGWGSRPGTSAGASRRLPPITRDGQSQPQMPTSHSSVSLALTDFVQGVSYGDGDRSGSPPMWRGRPPSSATQRASSARSETAAYAGRQSPPPGSNRRPTSRTGGSSAGLQRSGSSSGQRSHTPVGRRQPITPGIGIGADDWPLAQGVALVPGLQRRTKPVTTPVR